MFDTNTRSTSWKNRKLLFLIFIPVLLLAAAAVVQFLWNTILTDVAHAGVIGYWQALGLLVLCRILFGGFGNHGHKPHFGHSSALKEKWIGMNDEEKQKFRQEWKSRCAHRNP